MTRTPAPLVHGHHHLAIQVKDLARAERFYTEVLGLQVLRRWPWDDGRPGERSLWISVGPGAANEFVALEACDAEAPPRPFRDPHGGLHLLALRIAAADRAIWERRLAEKKIEIVHQTRWSLYLRDPEGNRIGLSHYPDDPPADMLVQRLAHQGIRDPRVLAAFARVQRARFLPGDKQGDAEADRAIEIGFGQTISQPLVVAAMTEALQLAGTERVLEVGTGSGYQTAILCELLGPSATLHSIEIVPELSHRARRTLDELGYKNFSLHVGDGRLGLPEAAPFDAILVAAAPSHVPPSLVEQLAPGGRLVIPVGASPESQELQLWRRLPGSGALEHRSLMQVRFVPLVR